LIWKGDLVGFDNMVVDALISGSHVDSGLLRVLELIYTCEDEYGCEQKSSYDRKESHYFKKILFMK
jgi:hypothetical protein